MIDTHQHVIAARAETLGLSAYAIAKSAELDPQTVKRFIEGRCALNSRYVSRICEVLGLELRPKKRICTQSNETTTANKGTKR